MTTSCHRGTLVSGSISSAMHMPTKTNRPTSLPRRLRVFIIDDQPLMREGLNSLFATLTRHIVVGAAGNVADAPALVLSTRPEVVLIDANLPAGGGFELGRELPLRTIGLRLIYLDDKVDDANVRAALDVNAAGYLVKSESFERIMWALDQVAEDKPAFCDGVAVRLRKDDGDYRLARRAVSPMLRALTQRELEVLEYLVKGLTVRQTAQAMDLAESTVGNHKSNLMGKLGVHRQVDLLRLAAREGLGDD